MKQEELNKRIIEIIKTKYNKHKKKLTLQRIKK